MDYYKVFLISNNDDFISYRSHQWYYFRSSMLDPNIEEEIHSGDVKHRLYVTIDFKELMNFTEDFVKELTNRKIPYLLKVKAPISSPCGYSENDTLVIYIDSEDRVVEYVNILNELINRNSKYKEAIHKPNAHLGIINGLIGYGKEFGKNASYSGIISQCGYNAVNTTLKDLNNDVIYRGQLSKISIPELLDIIKRHKNKQFVTTIEEDIYSLFKENLFKNIYEELAKKGYPIDFTVMRDKYSMVFGDPEEKYSIK